MQALYACIFFELALLNINVDFRYRWLLSAGRSGSLPGAFSVCGVSPVRWSQPTCNEINGAKISTLNFNRAFALWKVRKRIKNDWKWFFGSVQ